MKGEQGGGSWKALGIGRVRPAGPRYEKRRKATKAKRDKAKAKARRIMQKTSRRRNRR